MDEAVEFLTRLVTAVDTRLEIASISRAGDDVVQVGRSVGTVRGDAVLALLD